MGNHILKFAGIMLVLVLIATIAFGYQSNRDDFVATPEETRDILDEIPCFELTPEEFRNAYDNTIIGDNSQTKILSQHYRVNGGYDSYIYILGATEKNGAALCTILNERGKIKVIQLVVRSNHYPTHQFFVEVVMKALWSIDPSYKTEYRNVEKFLLDAEATKYFTRNDEIMLFKSARDVYGTSAYGISICRPLLSPLSY